ncbi:MAG: T9SS type A sorting domain-containing protein [Prolixibacteraceae bacterium]|nr:T9SS type A sorting domain-containing protein [Prolixibacteraceae bacterium]
MIRICFFILSVLLPFQIFAQVTTNPALPIETSAVTITFDSSKETRLGFYTSDLYAHTGVIVEGNTQWQHVIGLWGNNTVQPKLTNKGAGIYELSIAPDIRTFYSVLPAEKVKKIALVFRSADGTKQTNDILIDVFAEGLNVNITSPARTNIFEKNETFIFTASTTSAADLKLFLNNQEIGSQTGTLLTQNVTIPNAGNYWLKVKATQNTTVKLDSVYVFIRETTPIESRPAGLQAGINYTDDQSATLIVYAPAKNNIFVTGDFNNWVLDNSYQMKKDGDWFWLKIENLVPKKEYIFQYLIDGKIKIADPYTDKVSDPYDDKYISSTVYPNMLPYPEGKASDRASVLQTAQTPYVWSTPTYTIPEASKLSVYELLIRDFTPERTYKALQAKLDYLKRLGINTIDLMPVNEFEGNISWGYNPNFYFAPDKAYGTKNDLKALIDECHKQGFIVIQDMVLNHSFNSNPMVKMYWNDALNRPAADNPWFNQTSPNTTYFWGSDFNHERQATKDFVDRVNKYWMEEFKVDGFRFDFTKGFTNTPGDGGGYDASRIALLKRMADKIWEVNPKAYVILEHFAPDTEERELAAYGNGMLIWGNVTYNFGEAAMGYNESGKSDFSRASYQSRGYSKPGLLSYMESHDEERQLFKTISYGNAFGAYNTKEVSTALERSQLTTAFFLSLAGPKMIWQFGELGYDYSINYCENGTINNSCRTDPKPLHWDYLEDPNRLKLFDVYSAMLRLREQFDVFTSGTETLSLNGVTKKIQLKLNDHNITLIGNFGMADQTIVPNFQHTGTWYEFFSGNELAVSDVNASILLKAGEYRLYSDKKLPAFKDLATSISEKITHSTIRIYPNPASDQIQIESKEIIRSVELFSIDGKNIKKTNTDTNNLNIRLDELKPGLYFLRVQTDRQFFTEKVVKN